MRVGSAFLLLATATVISGALLPSFVRQYLRQHRRSNRDRYAQIPAEPPVILLDTIRPKWDPEASSSLLELDEENVDPDKQCVICMGKMVVDERDVQSLDCGHRYHLSCLDMWYGHQKTCPLCRTPFIWDNLPPRDDQLPVFTGSLSNNNGETLGGLLMRVIQEQISMEYKGLLDDDWTCAY